MEKNGSILDYLINQQDSAVEARDDEPKISSSSSPAVAVAKEAETEEELQYYGRDLLGNLIGNVERVIKRNEDWSEKLQAHNQYPLFNMKEKIKSFNIGDEMYDSLTFREMLVISRFEAVYSDLSEASPSRLTLTLTPTMTLTPTLSAVPVGGLCIDVQMGSGSQPFKRTESQLDLKMMDRMEHHGEGVNVSYNEPREVPEDDLDIQRKREMCKFLVHVSSDFDYEGKNGGSRITSWLDKNFHTLEELRREFVMDGKEIIKEKTLLTLLKPYKYYLHHTDRRNEFEERKLYRLSKAKDYISEGTNFVLMRYLAISIYIGTLEFSCMYINGDMCRNIYECTGPESGIINSERLDLCRIRRTIIEECGITHNCLTVLTLKGQIVRQDWELCDYFLHVNPLMKMSNEKLPGNDQILLQDSWLDDMQLMSKYLDDKSQCKLKMRSYLLDHPELKGLVSDYVQEIILSKPADIIEFTINHFLYFIPDYIPRYDYIP